MLSAPPGLGPGPSLPSKNADGVFSSDKERHILQTDSTSHNGAAEELQSIKRY